MNLKRKLFELLENIGYFYLPLLLVLLIGSNAFCSVNWAYIALNRSNQVSVINTETNQEVERIDVDSSPINIAITPDGKNAYVMHSIGKISVINTTNYQIETEFTLGSAMDSPVNIVFSPDGKKGYVLLSLSGLYVIDTTTYVVTILYMDPIGYNDIAITPDGTKVYFINFNNSKLYMLDTATELVSFSIPDPNTGPASIAITPDGSSIYVANNNATVATDHVVSIISTSNNMLTGSIPASQAGTSSWSIVIAKDGKKAYLLAGPLPMAPPAHKVYVINLENNTVINSSDLGRIAEDLALTSDGLKLYVSQPSAFSPNMPAEDIVKVIDTTIFPSSIDLGLGDYLGAYGIAITPTVIPLVEAKFQPVNSSGFQKDIFAKITWESLIGVNALQYLISQDGILIQTVPGSQFSFDAHYLLPKKSYLFNVQAVTPNGIEEVGSTIIMGPG